MEELTSLDDPRVAEYRVVKERELLRRRGVFVAEGRLVVERLLEPRCRYWPRSVMVMGERLGAMRGALEGVFARARAAGREEPTVFVVTRAMMDAVVGFRFHQGALAVGEIPAESSAESVVGSVLAGRVGGGPALLVGMEDLVDLDNVGSVFRNAAALGAGAVCLSPLCADPLYRKAIRTSMAQTLLLPWGRFGAWPEGLGALRGMGVVSAALTPAPDAVDLRAFASSGAVRGARGVLLLVGTEGDGLSAGAMRAADARVRIPMAPGVDSLNVATALAIALYECRSAAGVDAGVDGGMRP